MQGVRTSERVRRAYVLLALILSGTAWAAVVASGFVVGLGLLVRHLGGALQGEVDSCVAGARTSPTHTAHCARRSVQETTISATDRIRGTSTQQLLGVYDADGGLVGDVRYVVGHLLGTTECALCDITHAPLRRKPEWDRMVAGLDVPLEVVHRNRVPFWARVAAESVPLPVVLARTADGHVIDLLGPTELDACRGSVSTFRDLLDEALDRLG